MKYPFYFPWIASGEEVEAKLIIGTSCCWAQEYCVSGIVFLIAQKIPEAMSLGTSGSILWRYIVQFKQDFVLFLSPGQVFLQ